MAIQRKGNGVRNLLWLCGLIVGVASCASQPEIVVTSLPLAGEVRGGSASNTEASLQEVSVSDRGDRIVVARISLRNRTGREVFFGPQHVYLVDATGEMFPRISEKWLAEYYSQGIRKAPADTPPEAIAPFPDEQITLGNVEFRTPQLTADQREEMVEEMADLVQEAFVRPRRDAPGTFLVKGVEEALGVLLKESTLKPGARDLGFVYFYHSAVTKPQFPLRLIIDLEGEKHVFLFQ